MHTFKFERVGTLISKQPDGSEHIYSQQEFLCRLPSLSLSVKLQSNLQNKLEAVVIHLLSPCCTHQTKPSWNDTLNMPGHRICMACDEELALDFMSAELWLGQRAGQWVNLRPLNILSSGIPTLEEAIASPRLILEDWLGKNSHDDLLSLTLSAHDLYNDLLDFLNSWTPKKYPNLSIAQKFDQAGYYPPQEGNDVDQ